MNFANIGNFFGGGGGRGGNQQTDITIDPSDIGLDATAPTQITGEVVADILNIVYAVAAFAAIIVIIVGGIRYTSSNGDSNGIQTAKNTIMYAVVGLIVVIVAAAITNFVVAMVAGQAGGTGGTP